MPRYFITYDPLGFYRDDFHDVPDGATEISDEAYQQLALTPVPAGRRVVFTPDGQPMLADLPDLTSAELRDAKLRDINIAAEAALTDLSASYPDGEVQSWPQQTSEAEALVLDPNAAAPLLTAIATARGLAVDELANRVRAKVQAYAVASGAIIGQRQALEDALMAVDLTAPDVAAQLEAIQWPDA